MMTTSDVRQTECEVNFTVCLMIASDSMMVCIDETFIVTNICMLCGWKGDRDQSKVHRIQHYICTAE